MLELHFEWALRVDPVVAMAVSVITPMRRNETPSMRTFSVLPHIH